MESTDFRRYLQNELLSRCQRNPRYSLRAFADSLGVSHALLSMVFKNKRRVTPKLIERLGRRLNLNPAEIQSYLPRSTTKINRKVERQALTLLAVEKFQITSEWYYDVILELSKLKAFKFSVTSLSSALGLNRNEVEVALDRLQRHGMLTQKDGKWICGNYTTIAHNDFTSSALRIYQKQVLERSQSAVDEVEKINRDHSAMTVAIRKSDLPEVKEKIKNFRREVAAFLQREDDESKMDGVYTLAISFFPSIQSKKLESRRLKSDRKAKIKK